MAVLWGRVGLLSRLMLSVVLVILAAASVRSYFLIIDESAYMSGHLQSELHETWHSLAPLLVEQVVIGDFASIQQLLDTQVREREEIDRIKWKPRLGSLVAQSRDPVRLEAPAWFLRIAVIPALEKSFPIELGGVNYGTLTLRADPIPPLNIVWRHLATQLKKVSLVILIVLLLTAWVLRRNLKTLNQLSAAAYRFEQGEHSVRVEARGAREIRSAAHAFNSMAAKVEQLLQSLLQSESKLRAERERAQVTLSSIGDAVISIDVTGRVEYLNPPAERLTGWTAVEAQGRELHEVFNVIGETTRLPLDNLACQALLDGVSVKPESDSLLVTRAGRELAVDFSFAPIRDQDGSVTGCVLAFRDVSDKIQLMQQITWQAGHDPLTGLPNRSLLADRMEQALSNSQRQDKLLVVGLIDLDGFKEVNDLYGHELGDQLLNEVAQRFLRDVRGGDTVARLGGDEFVLLLTDIADMDEMEAALDRILTDVARPYQIDGRQVRISASIGVTVYPLNEADPESLLRHADQAMYQAKQAGRNRYSLFDVTLDQQTRFRFQERERVAQALRQGEMRLYYQPKVNMRTGQVIGFEALLRWQHLERGIVGPLEFLPQVEHTDLIVEIGIWVLQEAVRQLAEWERAGMRTTVSVNLAARHFLTADLVSQLRDLFERYPTVSPGSLELEILESAALEDIQSVRTIMAACQALGVGFALDDFGTGYSSLAYLKRLPANTLKIDQSFVRDMLEDADDLALIEGVVSLASIFKMGVIAEGVETTEHGVMLMRLGCDAAQGYGIARPMPAADVRAWAAQFRPDPAWLRWADTRWDLADFPLLVAQQDHLKWVKQVTMAVSGSKLALAKMELKDRHHCRFGSWFYGKGRERYGHLPVFAELAPIHGHVHEVGSEIIRLRDAGDVRAAEALCPKLLEIKDQVLDKLAELQNSMLNLEARV
jgi:diguanylate cyclase (GGDEF)-like protein/PAS domain S-box-containing protein